nr:MarR family transcriptional regulator [Vallitalea okinawensis]
MFNFIVELGDNGELNLSSLSKAVGVDNGHTTRAINKLVQLDYVKKVKDEKDARGYRVYLTDKGLIVYNKMYKHVSNMLNEVSKDVDANDLEVYSRVVDQLYDGFKAYQRKKNDCQ